jgi:hypothetical protein
MLYVFTYGITYFMSFSNRLILIIKHTVQVAGSYPFLRVKRTECIQLGPTGLANLPPYLSNINIGHEDSLPNTRGYQKSSQTVPHTPECINLI